VRLKISKRPFKESNLELKLRAHPQSKLVTHEGFLQAIATFF
jgi:hypothetical protein